MADRNEQVLAKVRETLEKYPTVNSKQLYDVATRMDPSLEEDGLRAFHARYVLPIRRAQAIAEGRPRKPRQQRKPKLLPQTAPVGGAAVSGRDRPVKERAPRGEGERARVRNIMLRFARELAAAESRSQIVGVVSSVDRFVEEIVRPPAQPAGDSSESEIASSNPLSQGGQGAATH